MSLADAPAETWHGPCFTIMGIGEHPLVGELARTGPVSSATSAGRLRTTATVPPGFYWWPPPSHELSNETVIISL
jgi:hypothetical protein